MADDVLLGLNNIGKCYTIYKDPVDRFKQMIFRNRRKFYREYWALQDISFDVKRGEVIGVIGKNGAGKSTLLQIVTGTLQPTTGLVTRSGRIAALLELGAGFNPEFSGAENVRLSASLLGLTAAETDACYDKIIEFAGIGDFLDQPVKFYSSGMYARLAFSVAAHVNADVMIVDETLAVGDAAFTQKCMRFFEEFKKRGTILFVSHDTAAVNRLCHRAIWLESGRMRMEGPAKDVTEAYLASTYAESTGDGQVRVLSGVRRDAVKVPAADIPNPPKPVVSVFDFNPDSAGFGAGGARISNVRLRALGVNPSAPLRGGEEIELTVEAELTQPLDNPIIGFLVKDRLGQVLFNRNTFYTHPALTYRRDLENYVSAKFQFIMPMLDNGDYSVTAAIADGTPQSNVQQHWLHDALFFQVSQADHGRGLIGVQMLGVEVDFSSSAN